MQFAKLKGHYRDESGNLNHGRLLVSVDDFSSHTGVSLSAHEYRIAGDNLGIEIRGLGDNFLPDEGECERIGMPVSPLHGNTGKQNALKDVTLDGRTAFRLPLEVKVAAEAAAEAAGVSASKWYVAAIKAALD